MNEHTEDTFSFYGIWRVLRRDWLYPVVGGSIGLAAGVAVALLSTPMYRAEVVTIPVSEQEAAGGLSSLIGQIGGLSSLAGFALGGGKAENEGVAVLRSRALVGAMIQEDNLLPVLFEKAWDPQKKAWRETDPVRQPTISKAQDVFLRDVSQVTQDRTEGLVKVRVEWKDRELAAKWANEIVARANAATQLRAQREAEDSIKFLQSRLDSTESIELRQGIYRLMEAQLKQIVAASARREYAFRVIDPAQVPDKDSFVRPRRKLVAILGGTVGGMLGLFLAVWRRGIASPGTTRQ